ncbi:MAG TPA: hypothetical protein VGG12_01775 [Methylovirgula sp.]
MMRPIVFALYVALMIALMISVDVLFSSDKFWEPLLLNIGIVWAFRGVYLKFFK